MQVSHPKKRRNTGCTMEERRWKCLEGDPLPQIRDNLESILTLQCRSTGHVHVSVLPPVLYSSRIYSLTLSLSSDALNNDPSQRTAKDRGFAVLSISLRSWSPNDEGNIDVEEEVSVLSYSQVSLSGLSSQQDSTVVTDPLNVQIGSRRRNMKHRLRVGITLGSNTSGRMSEWSSAPFDLL